MGLSDLTTYLLYYQDHLAVEVTDPVHLQFGIALVVLFRPGLSVFDEMLVYY